MSRAAAIAALVAALAAALALPVVVEDPYAIQLLFRVAIVAVLGVAWNLVGGYAGQLSLGHVAYFGLGGYGFSLLHVDLGVDLWPSLFLGALIACLAALVIGSITFRLRGPYFVLSTIAAAEMLRVLALNSSFTHGAIGVLAPSLFSNPGVDAKFYETAVVLLAASLGLAAWTDRSRFGYYLRAICADEQTAMAVGIDPARTKLLALVASAALTALAGGVYASFAQFVGPDSMLGIDISVQAAVVAMLGGAATVWGPLVGAVLLTLASEAFKAFFQEAHVLIYGLLLVGVVLFLPGGALGAAARAYERWRPRAGGHRPKESDR